MNTEILGTILLELLIIIIFAKAAGWVAHKIGQSAVLGELLVGLVIGPSFLHLVDPHSPTSEIIVFLAELGVIILLFEVGMESNIYKLLKVGLASALVAVIGVTIPFILGYYFVMGTSSPTTMIALFVGATLTATSVGITMRVFAEKKKVDSNEGKIILGAAVIDDVIGLIILSVLVGIVEYGKVSFLNIGKISLFSIIFLAGSIYIGIRFAKLLGGLVKKLEVKRTFAITAMIFALCLSYIANEIGLATIVGAFAAGLILETTEDKEHIRDRIKPLADVFVPIFFVHAGLLLDISTIYDRTTWMPIGVLFLIAIIGKVISGLGVIKAKAKKLVVGIGMIPRGEVGLIFATFGLTNNIIGPQLYAILVVVIMLTTFIAPPLLTWTMKSM